MILRDWNDIPESLKNEKVKVYYDVLKHKQRTLICKRIFDFVASLLLVLILSPIFIILAIWIKLDSKGPVFYHQTRICQYGKEFKIYKFRTMQENADKIGNLVTIQNDSRITKVGKKIRNIRLDEIPQVINVLKGEMTFVGTRPEVKKYVSFYTDEMKATLLLPPGITSLASITFKDEDSIISQLIENGHSIDDAYISQILPMKMKHNLMYVKNISLLKDIMICIRTII